MKKIFFVAREYTYPDRDSLLYQLDLEKKREKFCFKVSVTYEKVRIQ